MVASNDHQSSTSSLSEENYVSLLYLSLLIKSSPWLYIERPTQQTISTKKLLPLVCRLPLLVPLPLFRANFQDDSITHVLLQITFNAAIGVFTTPLKAWPDYCVKERRDVPRKWKRMGNAPFDLITQAESF